jgi:hypothetical protein
MATQLPTDIAATYPDASPGDATHQAHHDESHSYTNSHDTAVDPHGDRAYADTAAGNAVTAHEGATDPHPQYVPTGSAEGYVATSESTTSTTYVDLATVGPSASVVAPPSGQVLVNLSANSNNNTSGQTSWVSLSIAGSTPSDSAGISFANTVAERKGAALLVGGLTPGTTYTFTMKYRVTGGTGAFNVRRIAATPV